MLICEELKRKFLDVFKEGDISSITQEKINEILGMVAEIRTGTSSSGLCNIVARYGVNGSELRKVLEETNLVNSFDFSDVYEPSYLAHRITVRLRKVVVQKTGESAAQDTSTPRAASSSSDSQNPSCLGATTKTCGATLSDQDRTGVFITEKGVMNTGAGASLVGIRIRGNPSKETVEMAEKFARSVASNMYDVTIKLNCGLQHEL